MKSTSTALAAHLAGPVTTLATCWRISRIDGREFFFTDHDRDLAFEGNLYRASSGYSRTAIAGDASLSVDNLDVEGVFDSAAITEEELRAGLFDQAEVRIFIVNWADPAMGALRMRRGWFGEVVLSEQDIFRTELRGMTQALQQRIGELYSPECRADLGDHRCKVPVDPSEIARSTAYNVGDVVRVRTTGTPVSFALPIVNGSFEADGAGDGSGFAPTGWARVSGDWDVHDAGNGGLAPAHGSFYLEGGSSAAGELIQTLDLVAAALDPGQIDGDAYRLNASVQRANSFPDDLGRVVLEALDGAGTLLATLLDTGFEAILPEDSWAERGISQAPLPAGTRVLRIRLLHQLAAGSQSNAAFDAIVASITDTTASIPTAADYENRVYRCVSAGATAATQPAFDTSVGAQTTDGSAVFQAEEAWTRSGVVTDATDRAVFTAIVIASARSWLGTPYHDQASLRGVGCDCLGLARGVWRDVVGPEPFPIPAYSRDWGETGPREVLADGARRMMIEVEPAAAGPGALVLFRMKPRAIAKHVGILTGPGSFLHAYERIGVIEETMTQGWRRRVAFGFLFPAARKERMSES